jgi:uncharacterized membrane protein YcjF (UPF0283 family)
VKIPASDLLHDRSLLRRQRVQARKRLSAFMTDYPVDRLASLGFNKHQQSNLRLRSKKLLDEQHYDDREWLDEFSESYAATLDEVALRHVKRVAKQVALATAATPIGIVDSLIVVTQSFRMTTHLCSIYNARPGRLGIAVILGRSFTHAYLASEFEETARDVLNAAVKKATEPTSTTDAAVETVSSGTNGIFDIEQLSEGAASLCSGAAKSLAPKAAEAAANYFLIARLGRATMQLLRPIR